MMKKILFITTQFPYPLDNGGKIGAYNGLDSIAEHEVYLLAFSEQIEYVEEGKKKLCERWPHLHIVEVIKQDVHIQNKPFVLIKRILQSYFVKEPYMVVKFQNKEMIKKIDEIMQKYTFDAIFVDYLNMYSYGNYIKKKYPDKFKTFILKDHNIEYEIFKQTAEKSGLIKKIAIMPIWKKTKKYEENAVRDADIVLSVCDANTNYFKKINVNSYTMKPTFDIQEHSGEITHNQKLLFIGNLSWRANLNGLKWFVYEVLPIIKEKIPDVKLSIVGSGNVENPFTGNDLVEWNGFVEDISGIYKDYRVFVVPLFEGSGIRIKILEAFNYKIPVVATTLACETIGARNKVELYIADKKEEFAKAVETIIADDKEYKRITDNAGSFLKENFSVTVRRNEMNAILLNSTQRKIVEEKQCEFI